MTRRVLVIGDAFEDVYTETRFKKMCPDAPEVPAGIKSKTTSVPGGAANVAVNLVRLAPDDVQVDFISIISVDNARMMKYHTQSKLGLEYCVFDDDTAQSSKPIVKQRLFLDDRMVMRVDSAERFKPIDLLELRSQLARYLNFNSPDMVVLSDYACGVLQGVWDLLEPFKNRTLVDTKETDLSMFGGDQKCLLVKLNAPEWSAVLARDHDAVRHFDYSVVTRGADGADLFIHRVTAPGVSTVHTLHANAVKVDAVDVCGCGDTFLAALSASFLRNSDAFTAVQFANAAASTVVTQRRTAIADLTRTLELVGRSGDEAR